MNCYQHPDRAAGAYCRSCGRGLCLTCQRPAQGTVFCAEHAPIPDTPVSSAAAPPPSASPGGSFESASYAASGSSPYGPAGAGTAPDPGAPANPYMAPAAGSYTGGRPAFLQTSPGLALLLGLIPGVGAIYNGQYVKGLLHAAIFGLLTSMVSAADGDPGQAFLGTCTAAFFCYMPFEAYHTARKRQLGLPVDEWSSLVAPTWLSTTLPIGPVLLILVGVIFLLQSLNVLNFRAIGRFWPVVLIVVGGVMLYARLKRPAVPLSSGVGSPVQVPLTETPHE